MTRNEDRLHYIKVLLEKDGITSLPIDYFVYFMKNLFLYFHGKLIYVRHGNSFINYFYSYLIEKGSNTNAKQHVSNYISCNV